MKVKPLRRYDGLAGRYSIRVYPTVLLLRPDGTELGRIVGFNPPEEFLRLVRLIRNGRVLDDLVERLRSGELGHDELPEAIVGLRERGEYREALELHRQVHRKAGLGCCAGETWVIEVEMQARLYRFAGAWATGEVATPPDVPVEPAVTMLASLLEQEPVRDDAESLRRVLREARRIDTSILGARVPANELPVETMDRCAQLLYDGGDYEGAARLWRRAVENGIAWQGYDYELAAARLLDADTYLATAETWAPRALVAARSGGDPVTGELILLARLRAALGRNEEAVATARQAARAAIAEGKLAHARYAMSVARRCREGKSVERQEPLFERWPW